MIRNPFRRGEAPSEPSEADAHDLHRNITAERRQKLLFYGVGGALAVGAMAWILQPSTGYLATMVNGEVIRRHDEDTGARTGHLLRSGQGGR